MLLNTQSMIARVKQKGALGTITLPIKTFLSLTSNKRLARIKQSALSIADYNTLALGNKIPVMPFIRILPNGKVVGHEGRHRSWALHNEGERYITVGLIVTKPGTEKGKGKTKTYETIRYRIQDVPNIFEAQFSDKKIPVKLNSYKPL